MGNVEITGSGVIAFWQFSLLGLHRLLIPQKSIKFPGTLVIGGHENSVYYLYHPFMLPGFWYTNSLVNGILTGIRSPGGTKLDSPCFPVVSPLFLGSDKIS